MKNTNEGRGACYFSRLRAYFFTGIIVTAPLLITIAVAWWVVDFIDKHVTPLIPPSYNPLLYIQKLLGINFAIPGFGVLVLLIFITLIGALATGFLGRYIIRIGESILACMPIIRTIYIGSKQIFETLFKNQSVAFRKAVLIEYPRVGLWAMAFVTARTSGELAQKFEQEMVNVFLPTTPNPTSGFLLFVPKEEVIPLDISVEAAIKLIISAGIVTPENVKEQKTHSQNQK